MIYHREKVLAWISDRSSNIVAFFQEQFDNPWSYEAPGAGDTGCLAGNRRHADFSGDGGGLFLMTRVRVIVR